MRPMVGELLVEQVELRLPNVNDSIGFAVCGKVAVDLGEAPQPHRVGRQQLVAAFIYEEAQTQVPERQLKVCHVQRALRMGVQIFLGGL